MARQKKQYRSIEGQKRWEKILDRMTRPENFKWSLILLVMYSVLLFLSVYIPANILERPDIAAVLFEASYRIFPLVVAMAFINPLCGLWALWAEYKLQTPIKEYVEQHGSCTYGELIAQFMPVKIHRGIDDALEHLLRSYELVLEDDRYRLPTSKDRRRWRKEWLLEYDIRISFEDLEKLFSLDLDEEDDDTSIGFSLIRGGDYWIWKGEEKSSGATRFFFSSNPKSQQDFATFQTLASADLFDGQSLRSVWDDAVLTFFNDHEDIERWLEKYLC